MFNFGFPPTTNFRLNFATCMVSSRTECLLRLGLGPQKPIIPESNVKIQCHGQVPLVVG